MPRSWPRRGFSLWSSTVWPSPRFYAVRGGLASAVRPPPACPPSDWNQTWRESRAKTKAHHGRAAQDLRTASDRAALVRRMDGARVLSRRRVGAQGAVRDRHPAAQRHRLAAHGSRARRHDRGHLHALEAHGAPTTPCGCPAWTTPASRRRWWSSASCKAKEGKVAPRHRARGVRAAHLGVARAARRPHHRAAQAARLLARLGAPSSSRWTPAYSTAVHRGVRPPARRRAHLPRAAPHQLVRVVPDGALGSRGRARRGRAGRAVRVRLSAGRRQRRGRGRDHAAGDHARRHGGGGAPGGSAPQGADRQDDQAPAHRARDSRSSRDAMLVDPGVRHRRGEGHARARPQRLRDAACATSCR